LCAKQLAKRKAVDSRPLEVERHEIAAHTFVNAQGRGRFGRGYDAILGSLKDVAKPFAGSGIIVDY
jgi:hypothetical protein